MKIPGKEMVLELECGERTHKCDYPLAAENLLSVGSRRSSEKSNCGRRGGSLSVKKRRKEVGCFVPAKREGAHYGLVDVPGADVKKYRVKFTMPDQLTECQHCDVTSH